jgi:hypothetical protein
LGRCSQNPGTLGKSGAEEKMTEILNNKEVSLTDNPGGGYKGKGITHDEPPKETQKNPALRAIESDYE